MTERRRVGPAPLPGPATRRRLTAIAERALRDAGVLGTLPTPLEPVLAVAGIAERIELDRLPGAAGGRRVLGALWYEERTVFVEQGQSDARRRFTEAHEATHALCPWHRAVLRLDTADELFRQTRQAIEAEANFGAGVLIFQGGAFPRRAGAEPCTIAAGRALAAAHGASLHATVHHHVEHHRDPVALVVTGRYPRRDGSLPVWHATQSPSFVRRHGLARDLLGDGVDAHTPLREVIEAARVGERAPCGRVGRAAGLRAEAHYNRHAFLVLLRAPGGRGRR